MKTQARLHLAFILCIFGGNVQRLCSLYMRFCTCNHACNDVPSPIFQPRSVQVTKIALWVPQPPTDPKPPSSPPTPRHFPSLHPSWPSLVALNYLYPAQAVSNSARLFRIEAWGCTAGLASYGIACAGDLRARKETRSNWGGCGGYDCMQINARKECMSDYMLQKPPQYIKSMW
jgi:hypothetical protein